MNNDEYLNHLIWVSQDLTRQLAEVEASIRAHENRLDGEFVPPPAGAGTPADGLRQLNMEWWDRGGAKIPA